MTLTEKAKQINCFLQLILNEDRYMILMSDAQQGYVRVEFNGVTMLNATLTKLQKITSELGMSMIIDFNRSSLIFVNNENRTGQP